MRLKSTTRQANTNVTAITTGVTLARIELMSSETAAATTPATLAAPPGPLREFWYQQFHRLPLSETLVDGKPDAVRAYLFNSQLIALPGQDRLTLVAPMETQENPRAHAAAEGLVASNGPVGKAAAKAAEMLGVTPTVKTDPAPPK